MSKKKELKMYRVRIDKPSSLEMLVISTGKKAIYKKKIILGLPKGTRVRITRIKIKEGIIHSWAKVPKDNYTEEMHDSLVHEEDNNSNPQGEKLVD